jgi:hypothetical protein
MHVSSKNTAVSAIAAKVAVASSSLFLAVLAALHVVRPDLEPSTHMISEYAVGPAGWLMGVAFFALAGGFAALVFALAPFATRPFGRVGLVVLSFAALGALLGGVFPVDPASTPDHQSTRNMMHGIAFAIGVPSTLLAVTLLTVRLWRHPLWRSARPTLIATMAAVWLTMIVFAASMAAFIEYAPGPDFLVGWQNRALVVAWALWAFALGRRARTVRAQDAMKSEPSPAPEHAAA